MDNSGNIREFCCPNCAKHLAGAADESGGVRVMCTRCGVRLYSKQIKPKTYVIYITKQ